MTVELVRQVFVLQMMDNSSVRAGVRTLAVSKWGAIYSIRGWFIGTGMKKIYEI